MGYAAEIDCQICDLKTGESCDLVNAINGPALMLHVYLINFNSELDNLGAGPWLYYLLK